MFKIFPQDEKTVSNGRGIWEIWRKYFQLARKLVFTSQNEEFVEKKVYTRRKKPLTSRSMWKMKKERKKKKKMVSVSTSQNKGFVTKILFH